MSELNSILELNSYVFFHFFPGLMFVAYLRTKIHLLNGYFGRTGIDVFNLVYRILMIKFVKKFRKVDNQFKL